MKKMFKLGWQTSKSYFLLQIISTIFHLVLFMMLMLFSRYIGQGIVYKDKDMFYFSIIILVGILIIELVMNFMNKHIHIKEMKIDCQFEEKLFSYIMKLPYHMLEDPLVQDDIYKVHWGMMVYGSFGQFMQRITTLLKNIIIFLSIITLLQFIDYRFIMIIFLFIVGYVYAQKKIIDIQFEYENKMLQKERKYSTFGELFLGYEHGKDVRMYNSRNLFSEKFDQESIYPFYKERFHKQFKYMMLSDFVEVLSIVSIYGYIFYSIFQQTIPLSSFVMYITMMTTFLSTLQEFGTEIFQLRNSMIYIKTYFKFLDEYKDQHHQKKIQTWQTIEFKNVCYKYPHSDTFALKNINLVIHKGDKISIVGENGSGKTTFIKILLRLLPVTSGDICIDGQSIYDMSLEDYYSLFSVTFQDYKLLSLSLEDNLCMGQPQNHHKIVKVLKDFSLDFLVPRLSLDYSKRFRKDGILLSGGQSQRLAVVRSILKNGDIVVLDEPTASLDVYSEKQLYDTVSETCEDKTLLFISHRLASCSFANHILFLKRDT